MLDYKIAVGFSETHKRHSPRLQYRSVLQLPAVCSLECETATGLLSLPLSVGFGGNRIGSHKRIPVDVIE